MWAIERPGAKGICPVTVMGQPPLQNRRCRRIAQSPHLRQGKEREMNWDRVQGNWKQLTGKVKEQWGKLTEDDITVINGKQDQLVGRIQERYGIAKDEAQRQVDTWINRM
jgi:uncharacterized protein YjbJ (UPF0337 family)